MNGAIQQYLEHYGVKGQKWGVRRARRREHKDWKAKAKSPETANKVYQDAVKSFTPVLEKLNKDPLFADINVNRASRRQYDAVVATIFNQHLVDASAQTFNPKTGRAMIYQMTPDGMHMRAIESKLVGVEHAAGPPDIRLIRDVNGYVISCEVEGSMTQSDRARNFLAHHGVKGQRWGVRRTKAALARAARREGRQPSPEAIRAKALSKKKRSELSNEELRFLNERKNLEQNFNRLNPNAIAKGHNRTKAIIAVAGTAVALSNLARSPAGQATIKAGKIAVGNILEKHTSIGVGGQFIIGK